MKINRYMLQKVALAASILVVLNLFFNYGIATFYSSPKYDQFCKEETKKYYETKESCEAIGGAWVAYDQGYPRYAKPVPAVTVGGVPEQPTEYCDAQATCRKEFESATSLYNRNVFTALVILGGISVAFGFIFTAVSAVSSGFLFGGLLSFLVGTTRYWSDMNEYLRFIILGIVLAALVFIGYRKLRDDKK